MQYMQTALMVIQLIPELVKLVDTVESLIPGSGQGAAKLSLLKQWLETIFARTQQAQRTFEEAWPVLQDVIARIVALKNSLGAYKTSK